MAKLVANKYYNKSGEGKVNSYFATISKKIIEQSGIDPNAKIKIRSEKGKIIIEEDK